jgi:hypothetical protein
MKPDSRVGEAAPRCAPFNQCGTFNLPDSAAPDGPKMRWIERLAHGAKRQRVGAPQAGLAPVMGTLPVERRQHVACDHACIQIGMQLAHADSVLRHVYGAQGAAQWGHWAATPYCCPGQASWRYRRVKVARNAL